MQFRKAFLVPSFLVVSVAALSVVPRIAAGACLGGRFLVDGAPLIAGDVALDGLTIGQGVAIDSGCDTTPDVSLRTGRKGTRVSAHWAQCTGITGSARLRVKIDAACTALRGSFVARRARIRRALEATASTCGDAIVDRVGGEECETGADCDAGICDGCVCAAVATTTAPTTTSTSPLATTTTTTTTETTTTAPTTTTTVTTSTSTTTTTSTTVPACGNGVIESGETCDDANILNGDGCSATCQAELTSEIEPNDTTVQADATGLVASADITYQGAIITGNVDLYRVDVATSTVLRLETFTSRVPADCLSATTTVRLLDAVGSTILSDTSGAGISTCGALVIPVAPGTYYVQVEETGNNAAIAQYDLEIDFLSNAGSEGEAASATGVNDSTGTAETGVLTATSSFVFGDHSTLSDVDVWAITVPAGGAIGAEIVEGDRAVETCESNGIDSLLAVLDQNGTVLVTDDDGGRGFCSSIDGTGTAPRNAAAKNSSGTTQTYYLRVAASPFATGADGQFTYKLQVTIR